MESRMSTQDLSTLQQLNLELLDTLELCLYCTKDFCEKNSIPFYDEKVLALITKAEHLIDEISPFPYKHPTSVNMDDDSDEKLTEPYTPLYKALS